MDTITIGIKSVSLHQYNELKTLPGTRIDGQTVTLAMSTLKNLHAYYLSYRLCQHLMATVNQVVPNHYKGTVGQPFPILEDK